MEARAAKPREKEYKLTDVQGLYLLIKPSGSKRWYLKYRFASMVSGQWCIVR
ncbi:Arm DNA-binding domain-containing protein [Photorhabdus aegyptia]|uniref:Arm DNA-binding domain-containing protein n=2 Tax=Photorhabdus TaxID=29487 RepID=UPI001E290F03|nr:Arm DNA-binding domain-containing protein [Photorhabdus aegyptia]